MGSKKEEEVVPKVPRTVKVKTLVLVVLWAVSMVAMLTVGWTLKNADQDRVNSEAKVMLNSLIETAQNTKVSK